jgi:hypothetical protein
MARSPGRAGAQRTRLQLTGRQKPSSAPGLFFYRVSASRHDLWSVYEVAPRPSVIGVTYLRFWSLLPRSETNDLCRYDLVPCRYVERNHPAFQGRHRKYRGFGLERQQIASGSRRMGRREGRSGVAVASPAMHRSIICSTVKPCARMSLGRTVARGREQFERAAAIGLGLHDFQRSIVAQGAASSRKLPVRKDRGEGVPR